MKYLSLLFLSSLFSVTAHAQFSPEKYFSDSISYAFDECYVEKEKKKETTICVPQHYKVVVSEKQFVISGVIENSKRGGDHTDMSILEYGDMSSISFYNSKIVKHVNYGGTTNPAEVYELQLYADSDKPRFSAESKVLGKTTRMSVKLYFSSFEDAQAAKYYLQKMAKEAQQN